MSPRKPYGHAHLVPIGAGLRRRLVLRLSRSHTDLPSGFAWEVSGYFVGPVPAQRVPSYTRFDTQLSRRLGERVELSLVGQNLIQDHHLESNDSLTSLNPSQVKRSAYMKVSWQF